LIITSEIFAAEYAIGIEIKKDETAKWKIVIIIFSLFYCNHNNRKMQNEWYNLTLEIGAAKVQIHMIHH